MFRGEVEDMEELHKDQISNLVMIQFILCMLQCCLQMLKEVFQCRRIYYQETAVDLYLKTSVNISPCSVINNKIVDYQEYLLHMFHYDSIKYVRPIVVSVGRSNQFLLSPYML